MKTSLSRRLWFTLMGIMVWTGIYLTGFLATHWLFYLPAIGLTIAAIKGICPSQILIRKILELGTDKTSV